MKQRGLKKLRSTKHFSALPILKNPHSQQHPIEPPLGTNQIFQLAEIQVQHTPGDRPPQEG